MRFVKEVHYESGYTLSLRFDGGDLRGVDLAPYLDGEVFEPLKNNANF